MTGRVLDVGALVGYADNRPYIWATVTVASTLKWLLVVPSSALAEALDQRPSSVWLEEIRDPDLRPPTTLVVEADLRDQEETVRLAARTGVGDYAAIHAVLLARKYEFPVLTDRPGTIKRLDPMVDVIPLP